MRPVVVVTIVICFFPTPFVLAQSERAPRIHRYLEQQLQSAEPTDRLPVYAVIAERLGHDHWFPRVNRLHIDERRALVVAELKAHAARTQSDLLARLDVHRAKGRVGDVSSNWLGNFVRFSATEAVIRDLARLEGIEEIRYDAVWPRDQVEDSGPGVSALPARGGPGNGAINTKANLVWQLGYTGSGVVVMNADSGINIRHGDLVHRLWKNPGEIPANGVDDDGNGYTDDVHGWNFFDDNNDIEDGGGHGTQTAGTLVGDGLCSGTVTGQAPGARVMTAALGPAPPQSGPFTPLGEVAQWEAVQYAIEMGAHIQTSSYSYKNGFVPPPNYKMHREVGENSLAAGLIRTNSTGNNGGVANNPSDPNRIPFNVSTPGDLPPPYIDPNQALVGAKGGVIGVGAHDVNNNSLLSYSPRGPYAWHLEDVLMVNPFYPVANWSAAHNDYPWFNGMQMGLIQPDLTGPTNTTTTGGSGVTCALTNQSGTSNATPRVAGTLALWKGANMSLKPEDMAMIAHQSAVPSGSFPGKENSWGAGRVDALAGLRLALCTHRANGEPAWSITHPAGTPLTLEVDTLPNCTTMIAPLTSRNGRPLVDLAYYIGTSGTSGEVAVTITPETAGTTIYTRAFTWCDQPRGDQALKSNVIATQVVP